MNAEFYLLTFKIRIQVSTICCAKTQESICLKSSRGQLLMWTSGPLFSEENMADYNVESFSSSGSAMRLAVSTFGLAQQLFCFIQFFSSVSAASRIGIPSDLFPNLNIPMKHRQIGGQSARFTLHKRFSIAIRCLLLRQKKSLISAVDGFFACKWKYWCLSGERRPYKSFSPRPIVGLLTLSSHYWSHIHMPVHILVANCRLTVLLAHRISCAILGSQNALIKVGEVLPVWPAGIAILPSLEPQQLSNIGHN